MHINKLQNIHKGERVFVIGNGPSLTPAILDRLTGEYTIAVNRIAKIFPQTIWRPTYYVGITTAVNDARHRNDIITAVNAAQACICWDAYETIKEVKSLDKVAFVRCSHIKHHPSEAAADDWWSDDLSIRLDKFGVSVFSALQAAAWMGFTTIYLIGCDGNYRPLENGKDRSHFDQAYRPFDAYPEYDYAELNRALIRAHEIAENASKRLGIKIYNLSPISAIPYHERAELEDVL